MNSKKCYAARKSEVLAMIDMSGSVATSDMTIAQHSVAWRLEQSGLLKKEPGPHSDGWLTMWYSRRVK